MSDYNERTKTLRTHTNAEVGLFILSLPKRPGDLWNIPALYKPRQKYAYGRTTKHPNA